MAVEMDASHNNSSMAEIQRNTFANSTNRTAINVSFDENFDDIYNRRFRKYCLLLAKEKELLRRMGKVRKLRSTTLGPDEQEVLTDEEESPKRRPLTERRSTSLKEMRLLEPPKNVKLSSYRKLSTSYEAIDQDFEYEDNEEVPSKNHPRLIKPRGSAPHLQYLSTDNKSPIAHSHSCEGISSTKPKKSSICTKSESFDHADVVDILARITKEPSIESTKEEYWPLKNLEKNSLMTSSYRDLSDKNVRDMKSKTKSVRTSSPALQRRLAEAKVRQLKRGEVLRSLDDDFNKAKEIMNKYKSNENLAKYQSTENLVPDSDVKNERRRSWTVAQ